jgi:hypothetical protein
MACRWASVEISTVGMEIVRKVPDVGPEKVGIGLGLLAGSCAESGASSASRRAVRNLSVWFMIVSPW